MLILWIILGVIVWYGVGLIGSAIGLGAIDESLIKEYGSGYKGNDKKIGFLMALLGICNLVSAFIFSIAEIKLLKPKWYWLK